MPSKKRSNTSLNEKQPKFSYFVDRNLGSVFFPQQLRDAGASVVVHDHVYQQTERDPWIFYECGKKGLIVVTSDGAFMKSFTHMAAIALAKTTVIAFTQNNYKGDVRGRAFLKARKQIEAAITAHKKRNFIGIVGTTGDFRIASESPMPSRKLCDAKDWESYARVCKTAGVLFLAPK